MLYTIGVLLCLSPYCMTAKEAHTWQVSPPVEIRVGDIVVRKGYGTWTQYFINCSSREKRFSHVGIVVSNRPQCVIVHSDANERTGIGAVRLESWQGFYADALECAVFRYDGPDSTAKEFADRGMSLIGVPFDSAFDMEDTNKLYCTEFVRTVINDTLKTNIVGWTSVCNKKVVALDDIYRNGFKRIFDSHESECANNVKKCGVSTKAITAQHSIISGPPAGALTLSPHRNWKQLKGKQKGKTKWCAKQSSAELTE